MLLTRKILILFTAILIFIAWSNTVSKRDAERDRLDNPELYEQEAPPQMEGDFPPGTQPTPDQLHDEVPRGRQFDGGHAPRGLHSA